MLHMQKLRDGGIRLTLWHHIEPCPEDEERYDLILERSIPVIVRPETLAAKARPELIALCVRMTLTAFALGSQQQADLPLSGTFVETSPENYSLTEQASLLMRVFGRPLGLWRLAAPRVRRKTSVITRAK